MKSGEKWGKVGTVAETEEKQRNVLESGGKVGKIGEKVGKSG